VLEFVAAAVVVAGMFVVVVADLVMDEVLIQLKQKENSMLRGFAVYFIFCIIFVFLIISGSMCFSFNNENNYWQLN
jgi:uncharacterized membrane protein YdjX (TVP38/TMEM64 family)